MTETPSRLEIRRSVIDAIVAHARDDLPNECCGLLVGSGERIHRAVRARNLKASPTRYLIDPADHFATIQSARREGLVVMGAYHSHPQTPPVPSPTDVAEASDRNLLMAIVSPTRASEVADLFKVFRLVGKRFVPVAVVLDPDVSEAT